MLALVTADAAAPHDPDLAPVASALRSLLGDDAVLVASWDDPSVPWESCDAAVLRSTWDYPERLDEFLDFVARLGEVTRVINGVDAIRWSLDKHYLAVLADEGIPIVPTRFVAPGAPAPTVDGLSVVKPTVGAGSSGAKRCAPDQVADHVAILHRLGHTAMVQPYLTRLDEHGESAHCFVVNGEGDGLELSHVFRKGAILISDEVEQEGDLFAKEDIAVRTPIDDERELAEAVLATRVVAGFDDVMYARVDVAPTADGPVLMELELVEPSFYFHTAEGSAQRFARRIAGALDLAGGRP